MEEEYDEILQEFHQVKMLLYETGKNLVSPVTLVFRRLGFKAEKSD